MNWTQEIDIYCERVSPDYWAEPLNAFTNVFFLISAFIMWRRIRGEGMNLASLLVILLALIGIGSFLFHIYAQTWAALADTLPIVLFILVYFFAINNKILKIQSWKALLITMSFFPFSLIVVPVLSFLPFIKGSAMYISVLLLILVYCFFLRKRFNDLAKGMLIGASIFTVSLTFRILDEPICGSFIWGTHFLWHILNATLLGWMIEIYRKQIVRLRTIKEYKVFFEI